MNRADRHRIFKTLLMSLWGMATLVLLFTVVLLIMEMMRQGQDPMAALRPAEDKPLEERLPPSVTQTHREAVSLYFAAPDGRALAVERRELALGPSPQENCRAALTALLAGPEGDLTPVLPEGLEVRAVYLLEEGVLVVDLVSASGAPLRRARSVAMESLMTQSVAHTLTQQPLQARSGTRVRRVRFLFDGAPPQDGNGWHLDLSGPVAPDPGWISRSGDAPANG